MQKTHKDEIKMRIEGCKKVESRLKIVTLK